MNISLSDYTLFQKFKAEHTELYWKLFVIYLNWYSAEHRYGAGRQREKENLDEDLREYWADCANEFYHVQGLLAPNGYNRFFLNVWIEGVT